MPAFLKMFLASLLAVVVGGLLVFFFVLVFIGGKLAKDIPRVHPGSVLVLDLGQHYQEQLQKNALNILNGREKVPGLYDVVRLLAKAKTDRDITGLYVIA